MKIRVVGDVHGKYGEYLNVVDDAEYSIQVGDMGFDYEHMKGLDPLKHVFIGGNHDNYDEIEKCHHCHGNWGMRHLGNGAQGEVFKYFVARGAYSIDKKYRTTGFDWWTGEEMNHVTANKCLRSYTKNKPDIVISHDCPTILVPEFITNAGKMTPSFTGELLNTMFEINKPKLWIFGHHHNNKTVERFGTKFVCLDELAFMDIDTEKEL